MKRPLTLFFIHGKISKKSKLVYRVRYNRQQCYTLNHSTPNSEKQLLQQTIFKLTIKIINKELANPEQKAYWEDIAVQSNIEDNTARKAAYAHHSEIIKTQQLQQIIAKLTQQTIAAQTQQTIESQTKHTKQIQHIQQIHATLSSQLKTFARPTGSKRRLLPTSKHSLLSCKLLLKNEDPLPSTQTLIDPRLQQASHKQTHSLYEQHTL